MSNVYVNIILVYSPCVYGFLCFLAQLFSLAFEPGLNFALANDKRLKEISLIIGKHHHFRAGQVLTYTSWMIDSYLC